MLLILPNQVLSMSWIGNKSSIPLNRVFSKVGDIITSQWNENNLKMKVPSNPPIMVWRPSAQDSDNSEALNSNMNSKCNIFFYFLLI